MIWGFPARKMGVPIFTHATDGFCQNDPINREEMTKMKWMDDDWGYPKMTMKSLWNVAFQKAWGFPTVTTFSDPFGPKRPSPFQIVPRWLVSRGYNKVRPYEITRWGTSNDWSLGHFSNAFGSNPNPPIKHPRNIPKPWYILVRCGNSGQKTMVSLNGGV